MAPSAGSPESRHTRAFRALLALYPGAFRDEYGRELSLVFVDQYRHATSPWDRVRLWIEAIAGILADAPKEHARMIRQDLRDAARVLRQHALVTTVIVITLALGIGANTAVFSLLNAVVLRMLPVADADRVFTVNGGPYVASGQESARFSGPMFERLRRAAPPGVEVAAMSRGIVRVYTRTDEERETTPASAQLVSASFFSVVDVPASLGRTFRDEALRDEAVAVISHAYWQRRFAASPDIIGRTLTINGSAFTIVGVGPRGFAGVWLETPVDIFVPLTMQPALKYSQNFSADGADLSRPWLPQDRIWWLHILVRSPYGSARPAAAFNAVLSAQTGRDVGLVLEPFARGFSQFRRQFATPLVALMIMAALVLLVACANVANVLLARAIGRQREIAIRMAIGAGRARLLHQLLTESALLVMMAGIAAVLFAGWADRLLVRLATATTDSAAPFSAPIDLRVLAFTAGIAFLSVVIFGVWPAWRATRVDVVSALKSSTGGAIGGTPRTARVLVILQVALSLVLVTATGLFVRSFQNLLDVDLGIARERLLTVDIDPRLSSLPSSNLSDVYARLIDEVRAAPGVRSAALAMCGIQSHCAREDGFIVEGFTPRANELIMFSVNVITPDYFSTVGTPLLAGRALSDRDGPATPHVALVNKTLATRYFGGPRQAIGRRFGLGAPNTEIVGVVEDARPVGDLRAPIEPRVFVPLSQRAVSPRALQVRTLGDPHAAIAAIRRAVARVAPDMPIEGVDTIEERVQRGLGRERVVVLLTTAFGALALGLAGVGLFGVLSYTVARRTQEFGLRMALGASRSDIVRGVVLDALWVVCWGVGVGLPCVFVAGRFVSVLVFGVSPYDGPSAAAAIVILLGVGAVCAALPARRAARVDPMIALRRD